MFAASKTSTATSGYQISRSLRFNTPDAAYLNRTPASASNRKTWTFSTWIKRSKATGSSNYTDINCVFTAYSDTSNYLALDFATTSTNSFGVTNLSAGSVNAQLTTTATYRDTSAWYHFVVSVDTTQATASNRMKIYVNGVEVTSFSTATYPAQNTDLQINNNVLHQIGRNPYPSYVQNYDGYMTEVNFIDGTQLTPSSFGETNAQTGVWQPKAYSGSYGTNGFYLNFSDNSNTTAATLGKDYSGNGNNWTPNNFSVTAGAGNDSLVDSPTSYGTDTGVGGTVRGNYCTLNPLDFANGTLSNGNLDWSATSGTGLGCFSTFAFDIADSTNQYYWEFTLNSGDAVFGIVPTTTLPSNTSRTGSYSYYTNGNKYSGTTATAYGASFTTGAVIGVSVGSGTITFYKNGVSQGAAFTGLTGIFKPAIWEVVCTATANFGQRPFAYTAPSGFKALCTQNLPTPVIGATSATLATQYFNPVLYTGNGASPRTVTGVGFQPDFVWMKARSQAYVHGLANAVTGVNKFLISNSTAAETTNDAYGYLSAFNSDGFVLTAGSASNDTFNRNTDSFVAWNWKANGAGSTNTAGSITSTVSANTTSGFSVVTYTGTGPGNFTVGHGLGVAPSMIILKNRDRSVYWMVYTATTGINNFLRLNTTDASTASTGIWGTSAPTSTVFGGAGTDFGNGYVAGEKIVAYCFAPIAGYSAFGSYTGNGVADGPFIYCGFRPAFVMFKNASSTGAWGMYDRLRAVTYNPQNAVLYPNYSNAENIDPSYTYIDFVSNGIKIRSTGADFNYISGNTYIFMAFAENPFKTSLAR